MDSVTTHNRFELWPLQPLEPRRDTWVHSFLFINSTRLVYTLETIKQAGLRQGGLLLHSLTEPRATLKRTSTH